MSFVFAFLSASAVRAADAGVDYLEPKVLTGTIYADASLKQVLFTFRRTATNSGSEIHVVREFNLPNGTVAAREQVVYEGNRLKTFMLQELQTGAMGRVIVQPGARDARLSFNYSIGPNHKTGSETLQEGTLISDMVGPFIASHWDELAKGAKVKCRLVSVSRAETVGFKLVKESDTTWHGKPVMMVTLQPASIIIAQFVDPLHFVVEKDKPHRVLEYTGRTTPSIQRNGKWEELDAVTVFDWK